jgi:pimeloyl-ACP methyl ester carboxylesterase
MALARQHPDLFGSKVTGVVLISTVAGGVDPTIWIPMVLRPVARHAAPPLLRGVSTGRRAAVVERGRQVGADLALLGTWYVAFGNPEISPAVVAFLERIIRATPVGVVAAFYLAVLSHDERAALSMLSRVPVTVIAGERDRLVSLGQSEELAAAIPGSELVVAPGAGHVVIREQPGLVNGVISDMISGRSAAAAERRPA